MSEPQRVAVVTGSRADFGLLDPVMRAISAHPDLELLTIVAGAHLLPPDETRREVADRFEVAATVEMQRAGDLERVGGVERLADAMGAGRGIGAMAEVLASLAPHWIVVLGDRIEAFGAASAGSIGGIPVAHLHGGDRAEGVADEAMRHAITKLAHLHLPATESSAARIERMGEPRERIVVVGSPAIDGLDQIEPATDAVWELHGAPDAIVLFHPIGDAPEIERARAEKIIDAMRGRRVLFCAPNVDPGHAGIREAFAAAGGANAGHLPRATFLALLRRLAERGGALVGNSSAGLIEAPALGVRVVDVGERQSGRERGPGVVHVSGETPEEIRSGIEEAAAADAAGSGHPYGDGRAGERVADAIAARDARGDAERRRIIRKRNAY